jgi:NDP-sugar pyrophosphorylase family protein
MSKRAVILAGGKGTRLRPYTLVLPKPLMPIGDFPILEVVIRQLAAAGFSHVTMAVNHQAEIIKAFFQNGERWNLRIDYTIENDPLGTMGPLRLINDLPENFLVMNGDILTDLDYCKFYESHCQNTAPFTISSKVREQRNDYGVLDVGGDGVLTGFREKPIDKFQVSMGVYMINRETVSLIPEGMQYGFDSLMLELIARGTPASVIPFDGYWLDIGRPDDYEKAIDVFEAQRTRFLPIQNIKS